VTNSGNPSNDEPNRSPPGTRSATPHRTNLSKSRNKKMMNPTQQQLIAYKLKIASQLADSLALSSASDAVRKGLRRLISETVFDAAIEVRNLEPEEIPLRQVLATFRRRTASAA
jgi:hypothetical protein